MLLYAISCVSSLGGSINKRQACPTFIPLLVPAQGLLLVFESALASDPGPFLCSGDRRSSTFEASETPGIPLLGVTMHACPHAACLALQPGSALAMSIRTSHSHQCTSVY